MYCLFFDYASFHSRIIGTHLILALLEFTANCRLKLENMAARSSSSSDDTSNFTREKFVALDSLEDRDSGVEGRISEAESSSHMEQLKYSQKEKGKAIISGAADFDEISGIETASIECGCCYRYFQIENMAKCPKGHRFCCKCVRRHVEEIIYGGLQAHASLRCISTDYCEESIPLLEIRRTLTDDVFEKYEYRQAQEAIREAKLEGLVYCPFCNIPYEVDKCIQVLDCPNPKCLKASCIQCKKPSHIPSRCEEVEKLNDTDARREVEERMTKAVIRECSICQAKLIKMYGCNKVACICGNTMCYVCRQTILPCYSHFCSCSDFPSGKICKTCNKCSMTQNEVEDNEALAAKEEALKEFVDKEPNLLDMEIGPPFEKLRKEAQGPYIQRLPQHLQRPGIPVNMEVIHAQLANMRFQAQRAAQHLPQPFPANMHLPYYDQLRNMDLQAERPPQHLPQRPLSRHPTHNLPHFANMYLQPQRPPQHLGPRFPPNLQLLHDHHQLATTHLQPQRPPQHLPQQFPANMQLQHDDQVANMHLQPQRPPQHLPQRPLPRRPAQNLPHPANMQLQPQRPPQHLGPRLPANIQLLHDHQLATMHLQPQRPQHFPANMQLQHDDQVANMQLQAQRPLPRRPQNLPQLANMHLQAQNPPRLLPQRPLPRRAPQNLPHPANMQLQSQRPQHLPQRFPEIMQIQHDDRHANMLIEAQEDKGRQEEVSEDK